MCGTKGIVGSINLKPFTDNGERFVAEVSKDDKFGTELVHAFERGEDPAEALHFLAELAVTHLNPYHFEALSGYERALWEKFFGPASVKAS